MAHGNDPRGLLAINVLQILEEPLVLFVCLVVGDLISVDGSEWAAVSGKRLTRRGMAILVISQEAPLGRAGVILSSS